MPELARVVDILGQVPSNGKPSEWPLAAPGIPDGLILCHEGGTSKGTNPFQIAEHAVKADRRPHINYHFVIYDGVIYQTLGLEYAGYVEGAGDVINAHWISACIVGNYNLRRLSPADLNAVCSLWVALKRANEETFELRGHLELPGITVVDCPGKNIDMDAVRGAARQMDVSTREKVTDAVTEDEDPRLRYYGTYRDAAIDLLRAADERMSVLVEAEEKAKSLLDLLRSVR